MLNEKRVYWVLFLVLICAGVFGYINIQTNVEHIKETLISRESPIETRLTRDSIALVLKKLGCSKPQIAPYAVAIEQECKERKTCWKWVVAQIRRESFFDPSAKSFVKTKMRGDKEHEYAWGLLQIKPNTAKDIASELDEDYDFYKLFDGVTNIRWGVYYFQKKMLIHGYSVEKAVKAYNGGSQSHWEAVRENYQMICEELKLAS